MQYIFASILLVMGISFSNFSISETSEVLVTGEKGISSWTVKESDHIVLISDAGDDEANALLVNLERLDYVLRVYTKTENVDVGKNRLKIYYSSRFDDLKLIDDTNPSGIGLYTNCRSGSSGFAVRINRNQFSASDFKKIKKPNENFTYIFEAYTKHFIYRNTDIRSPDWFITGMSHYFSTSVFSEKKFLVGKSPNGIREYLNYLSSGKRSQVEFKDILTKSVDTTNLNNINLILEYEARAWLLTHFILSTTENVQKMITFSRLTEIEKKDPISTFESLFSIDIEKLRRELSKYRLENAEALVIELPKLPDPVITTRNLPNTVDSLILLDASLEACPNFNKAQNLYKTLVTEAAKFPNDKTVQSILAKANIELGNPIEAATKLLALGDSKLFDVNLLVGKAYLYGALLEKNSENRNQFIESSKKYLRNSLGNNPQDPTALYYLYLSGLVSKEGPTSETFNAGVKSWKYGHDINEFARTAALIYAHVGKLEDSREILNSLSISDGDMYSKNWAKEWLEKLKDIKNKDDIYNELIKQAQIVATFKEWTVASDRMMRDIAEAEGLNSTNHILLEATRIDIYPWYGVEGVKRFMFDPSKSQNP